MWYCSDKIAYLPVRNETVPIQPRESLINSCLKKKVPSPFGRGPG